MIALGGQACTSDGPAMTYELRLASGPGVDVQIDSPDGGEITEGSSGGLHVVTIEYASYAAARAGSLITISADTGAEHFGGTAKPGLCFSECHPGECDRTGLDSLSLEQVTVGLSYNFGPLDWDQLICDGPAFSLNAID
jgi:hypothetical protein